MLDFLAVNHFPTPPILRLEKHALLRVKFEAPSPDSLEEDPQAGKVLVRRLTASRRSIQADSGTTSPGNTAASAAESAWQSQRHLAVHVWV